LALKESEKLRLKPAIGVTKRGFASSNYVEAIGWIERNPAE
jgi:hypothetical protein